MEVTNGVYVFQFDTEYFGNDRTWHPTGVETDRGLLLFDVGGPGDADALEAALEADGFAYDDVDKIVLTHHDYDHLGCLEAVHDRTDAEVVAHERAAPYVTADIRMLKRPEEPYGGVPVDIELTGGERFHTHAGPVRAIFTPGHAPGHLVYHFEDANVLVAGDLLGRHRLARRPRRRAGRVLSRRPHRIDGRRHPARLRRPPRRDRQLNARQAPSATRATDVLLRPRFLLETDDVGPETAVECG
jgi:glyoxylase-like metal-dependent hydrolase (beta-lactamase superfamily II)